MSNWTADHWGADFPYGTLLINVTGAFVIGLFLPFVSERIEVHPLARLFFINGFLGGSTPFSQLPWEGLPRAENVPGSGQC